MLSVWQGQGSFFLTKPNPFWTSVEVTLGSRAYQEEWASRITLRLY